MFLQAKIAIDAAQTLLNTSKEQGFLVYILVCMIIFFAILCILMAGMYIKKQNKLVETLEKAADTKKLIEALAEAKIREVNAKPDPDVKEIKQMIMDFLINSRKAASRIDPNNH